jgi:Phycobilisome protein
MNLLDLLRTTGDRHLTASEREQLRCCASGLETAARVSAAVEECEAAAVEDVVAALRARYPRFGQLQPQAWERLAADLELVLRHDLRALLLGDPRSLDSSVLFYLRSIFAAYRLSHGFLRECFTLLRHQLAARLEPDDFATLAPYLERNIEVLASGAEPAAPVV